MDRLEILRDVSNGCFKWLLQKFEGKLGLFAPLFLFITHSSSQASEVLLMIEIIMGLCCIMQYCGADLV